MCKYDISLDTVKGTAHLREGIPSRGKWGVWHSVTRHPILTELWEGIQ